MLRAREKPNLDNYIRITEFAAAAGVTPRSIRVWLTKPKVDPEVQAEVESVLGFKIVDPAQPVFTSLLKTLKQSRPELYRLLKSSRTKCISFGINYKSFGYISLRGAEVYMQERSVPRVALRPANSMTIEAAQDIIPYGRWKLYQAIFAGDINAVMHSQTMYLDKTSVEAYALRQKSLLPIPGWIYIKGAAESVGRTYPSLHKWLKTHHRPIRKFLHPKLNRICSYMRQQDFEDYKRLVPATSNFVPKVHRHKKPSK